jgi:hypothetical protein
LPNSVQQKTRGACATTRVLLTGILLKIYVQYLPGVAACASRLPRSRPVLG